MGNILHITQFDDFITDDCFKVLLLKLNKDFLSKGELVRKQTKKIELLLKISNIIKLWKVIIKIQLFKCRTTYAVKNK